MNQEKIFVVVRTGRDGRFVLEAASSGRFDKLHAPSKRSLAHAEGEIWEGVVEHDTQPDNPHRGVKFVRLERKLESEPVWTTQEHMDAAPWFAGWYFRFPDGQTVKDFSRNDPAPATLPLQVLAEQKAVRTAFVAKREAAIASGPVVWVSNRWLGVKFGQHFQEQLLELTAPVTAEQYEKLRAFAPRGLKIEARENRSLRVADSVGMYHSFDLAPELFASASPWAISPSTYGWTMIAREETFVPTGETVRRSLAVGDLSGIAGFFWRLTGNVDTYGRAVRGPHVGLPAFPSDCSDEVAAEARRLYAEQAEQVWAKKSAETQKSISAALEAHRRQMAAVLKHGSRVLSTRQFLHEYIEPLSPDEMRGGGWVSEWCTAYLVRVDGESQELLVPYGGARDVFKALLAKIRCLEGHARLWGMNVPVRVTPEEAAEIRETEAIRRQVFNVASEMDRVRKGLDRHIYTLPLPEGVGVFSFGEASSDRFTGETNWLERREYYLASLPKAREYLRYLQCRAVGEPWDESERMIRVADNGVREHCCSCPLCGREFSERGTCSIGAYDNARGRHDNLAAVRFPEDGSDPVLKRLVTETGLLVAVVRLARQGQHHNEQGLYDNDVYVVSWRARLSWWQGWWDGRTPFASIRVEVAPPPAPAKKPAPPLAAEPVPAVAEVASPTGAFADVGDRYFKCTCGCNERIGKADWKSYQSGEELTISCSNCRARGIVKK